MVLEKFHPAVRAWFEQQFSQPTEVQSQAWPAISGRRHTLIAAPTGSGKTLAAFLASIDELVLMSVNGALSDETHILYVSPLKALSNDIQKNLQQPLQGITAILAEQGLPDVGIRASVRTGDTPQSERQRMRRLPPHILVTTPETLYILLTSESGRKMLKSVRTVIVDEIHALAGSKRGSHLALSLQRLEALCASPPVRVGLSATQKPISQMACFLTGTKASDDCTIIDTGHVRKRDLSLEITATPLAAVLSNEAWQEIYDRLADLIEAHHTTLIFVNTRRLAERAARFLAERLGEEHVTAHHGSLAKEHRLDAEQRLKGGKLRALVATASLELGIDIGDVDLVCQLGTPRSIAAFLQRVGRSGHAIDGLPKGRLFPLTRDDLVECAALLDAIKRDELDRTLIPKQPIDVLSQQIVAEVASQEWDEEALYHVFRKAWPYESLTQDTFSDVVRMLSDGFSTRRGRRAAYLHRDVVNGRLRPRRGARLTAITNGGAIPDQFDYDVILSPEGLFIGNLNEDFAFESLPGDIFQLGNTSYRILKIEQGKVHVQDAHGQPPNIPFWFGEAPGRSDELSYAVSRLRESFSAKLDDGLAIATTWLHTDVSIPLAAAQQLSDYLACAKAALGVVPSQSTVVFERFFDEVGDMHLVIHSSYGSRINRAWGLSLRKRFCRKFNFELQAAATEDNIVLSFGPTHSFVLEDVADYLKAQSVRQLLIQALLDAPMFATRWRWNASIALAVKRMRNGKRLPAQFQRSDAEDLVAVIFPDQLACLENIAGNRDVPDHPLVNQTLADCLHDTMDIDGLERLLTRLAEKEITLVTCDLTSPSPLAQEILNARPFAFLDDAPAEERRTLLVQQRHYFDPHDAAELGRLDPTAIARVCEEAWPDAGTADELHDGLTVLGFMTIAEGEAGLLTNDTVSIRQENWQAHFAALEQQQRVTVLTTATGKKFWVAAERLAQLRAVFPDAKCTPAIRPVQEEGSDPLSQETALIEIIRSRMEGLGPVRVNQIAVSLGLSETRVAAALLALEQEGFVIQGRFTDDVNHDMEWCERRLLARIHRYTMKSLRSDIEPVPAADYMRFLFHWHGLVERGDGQESLASCLSQLEGFAIAAGAWESDILPSRLEMYLIHSLDNVCSAGRFVWQRLLKVKDNLKGEYDEKRRASPVRNTPIVLMDRQHSHHWRTLTPPPDVAQICLSSIAHSVADALQSSGASFFDDIMHETGLLRTQVEEAVGELVAWGLVTSDSFAGLRALITPGDRRPGLRRFHSGRRRRIVPDVNNAGRWTLLKNPKTMTDGANTQHMHNGGHVAHIAKVLLRRYGVVFRKVLERESNIPPWRELLYVYRRMEARGELRGGRFVQQFSGEQYALPEAVSTLRESRKQDKNDTLLSISATDPLNLTGIITPGERVPAHTTNRLLYRNGIPIAVSIAGDVRFIGSVDKHFEWQARRILLRKPKPTRPVGILTSSYGHE